MSSAQLLKGVLALLLLRVVRSQEDYGYSIVVRLRGLGLADLGEGTVYPALTRLESQGLLSSRLVASASGPARKYYSITEAGLAEVERLQEQWHVITEAVAGAAADERKEQHHVH